MPAALSMDLRERVITAYLAGEGSFKVLGARFQIGEASVNRWVRRHRETGSVAPSPHGGGVEARIPSRRLDELAHLIEKHSDATLPQLAELCSKHFAAQTSTGAVCRALRRANITRKKSP